MEDNNAPESTSSDNVLLGGYDAPQENAAPVVEEGQAPQVEAPVSNDWTGSFDDETKAYIENKAWTSPSDMLQSYQNLEKLKGGNAEQLHRVSTDIEDDARQSIYNAMGRPESADKYTYQAQEGDSPELVGAAKDVFHKYGLSDQQVNDIIPSLNEQIVGIAQAQTEAINAKNHQDFDRLKNELGANFDVKVNFASRAATHFGITEDMQRAVVASGHAADFTKALANIGSLMAEGDMVGMSPDQSQAAMGVLSPESAQSKIDQKFADKDFMARYHSQDQSTRMKASKELDHLRKAAIGK